MTRERILVVEDESIVTELLQEFLKNLGYEIAGVTGYGEDAVILAAERCPDLILMDIKLRGEMSGVEASKQIREHLDIPVVYLTAYADDDTVQRAKLTAPFGYIQKPFKGGEVRSAIEIALYRSRMEKMLKEREHSYRVLAETLNERNSFIESIMTSIQSGIIVVDLDLNITLTNPYVAKLCNKTPEELVGRSLRVLCPEMGERIAAGIDSEELRLHLFAQELTVGYSRFDLFGPNGAVNGHIIALKDLSEIVEIRREMRKKERLATMGEVVARVAHEMRNPLFAITAVAQILGMELELTSQQKELMNSLLTEGRRLNHLVEELLDCSKELRLKKKVFDLVKIINESIRVNDSHIASKEIVFRKTMPEMENLIEADPERVEQVLINLLQNAIDASPTHGIVELIVSERNGEITMAIADNGPGIADASLEKIFEVFYTTKKRGTGLGLPISKKIVEAHGGSLTVTNNPSGGATAMVVLPVKPVNAGDK